MKVTHTRHRNDDAILLEAAKALGFYKGSFAMDEDLIICMITDVVVIRGQEDFCNPNDDYYSHEVDQLISDGHSPVVCAMLNYLGGLHYLWPIEQLTIPK
jgi:hypothetical protein